MRTDFDYRVTVGWLRDLASQPTPDDAWPCTRWDDQLERDQLRFLDAQAELGVTYNLAWGLFVDRAWPAPLDAVIDDARAERVRRFTDAAHARGLKALSGVGVYSWGFDEIIAEHPEVARGGAHVMCAHATAAWGWQRRVLDYMMDDAWGLDGISMQSADLGRCECDDCGRLSPAEHHALLIVRCAEYVRASRPDWTIGQASWGLRVDEPEELQWVQAMASAVDYSIEVRERSAAAGARRQLISGLDTAFGTVGGVFVEPPQHWARLRWFVPCGLASAESLRRLWNDGGRACEYFHRPFENPAEEVSWRTGAMILSHPEMAPMQALAEAVTTVYGVTGDARDDLSDWFRRGEEAYFSRANFEIGDGPLSLEPLVWSENRAAPGPAVYLRDRMSAEARHDYGRELVELRGALSDIAIPAAHAVDRTRACIEGTLRDIETLA
ncbi:hypothetical protein HN371_26950 [Candidatus Poribacteria bacterium]|jgi:hypothetical protein|nr:hypothetical protein [Candidatus Poribacteria bacterium]MBT5533607.1 hypothetical protein [Candidatus Poribacteria bacterium]MBT5712043.1 hypothetical protein [Candidatus Poribacteria bacterium]MBT7100719.1 hypothetical protein [Candidatus Poribacteria bacterium]MBT7805614.1 hypothetical protein [Candidatus Poribacteria bacterium]